MLQSDNKPAEETHSGISRMKHSLNSRILKENSAQDKCLKVVEWDLSGNLLATKLLSCIDLTDRPFAKQFCIDLTYSVRRCSE